MTAGALLVAFFDATFLLLDADDFLVDFTAAVLMLLPAFFEVVLGVLLTSFALSLVALTFLLLVFFALSVGVFTFALLLVVEALLTVVLAPVVLALAFVVAVFVVLAVLLAFVELLGFVFVFACLVYGDDVAGDYVAEHGSGWRRFH